MKHLSVLYPCLILLFASNIYAADYEPWSLSVTPYIWGVNIDGDIEVGVPADGIPNQLLHISEKFSNILKHVYFGGIVDVDAYKGKFGIFANIMFVNIKGLAVTTSDGFDVLVDTKFGLFSGGVSYKLLKHKISHYSEFTLEPYLGLRYTNNTSGAVLAEAPENPEFGSTYHAHWTEPFIGATLSFDINQYWLLKFLGDIGGINKNQDSYDIIGIVGYAPVSGCLISIGYRQFYQSFTTGSGSNYFNWKMHINGPIIGVTLRF